MGLIFYTKFLTVYLTTFYISYHFKKGHLKILKILLNLLILPRNLFPPNPTNIPPHLPTTTIPHTNTRPHILITSTTTSAPKFLSLAITRTYLARPRRPVVRGRVRYGSSSGGGSSHTSAYIRAPEAHCTRGRRRRTRDARNTNERGNLCAARRFLVNKGC